MTPHDTGDSPTVAEALDILDAALGSIDRTEPIPIESGVGRVLAAPVSAALDQPHYRRSERDGYAVRSEDVTGATPEQPIVVTKTDDSVGPREASYVHTGSAVPAGADAVVMIEDVTETKAGVEIRESVDSGDFVTPAGADLEAGTQLFDQGHRLRPGDLGTLKVAGVRTVSVVQPPMVAVIPTGDELVQTDPGPGEVLETNGLVGSALVEQWGADPQYREVIPDDETKLRQAIERDLDADIIVTSGGSSVGSRDVLPSVVAEMGEVVVEGLALRPGHSTSVGMVSDTPSVMLPGTPIASLVVAWVLVRPAIAAALGTTVVSPPTVHASSVSRIDSVPGKRTVHGIRLESSAEAETTPVAHLAERGGLPSLARIDGWVQVGESRSKIAAGEPVAVERWGDWCS